jgi:hypothetical protein
VPSVILAAGLLVLLGLGLFVGGVLTGATALYWGCVAACVVAAALLGVARRRIFAEAPGRTQSGSGRAAAAGAGGTVAPGRTGEGTAGDASPDAARDGPVEARAGAARPAAGAAGAPAVVPVDLPDPPVEDVEVTDLLMVVDLKDEVLVIDERPRYHLAGCAHLAGRETIPLPVDEARSDGFTPCAVCEPDRNLAARARARKASRGS